MGIFELTSQIMSALNLLLSLEHFQVNVLMLEISALAQNNQLFLAKCVLLWRCFQNPLLVCLLPLVGNAVPAETRSRMSSVTSWKWLTVVVVETLVLCWNMYVHLAQWLTSNESYQLRFKASVAEVVACGGNLENLCNLWIQFVGTVLSYLLEQLTQTASHSIWYEPSLGIRWYLDAQILPEYRLYFEALFLLQPIICAGLVYHYISPKCPVVAVHVMSVIILLFSRGLVALDIVFSIALLCQHLEVIQGMRNVPYIVAGIAVPLVVSSLMLTLWVERGTGNANYFFFQGICLWLFCALGIVEFTGSFMRSINVAK